MPQKRYTKDNKKPYGAGHGYGGFANHAFTKDEYDTLHGLNEHVNDPNRSVIIHGVKSKKHPGETFTATVELDGNEKYQNGREKLKLTGWEKETVQKGQTTKSEPAKKGASEDVHKARVSDLDDKFGHIVDQQEQLAQQYVNASEGQYSESELSDMALAYQDRDTGGYGD